MSGDRGASGIMTRHNEAKQSETDRHSDSSDLYRLFTIVRWLVGWLVRSNGRERVGKGGGAFIGDYFFEFGIGILSFWNFEFWDFLFLGCSGCLVFRI